MLKIYLLMMLKIYKKIKIIKILLLFIKTFKICNNKNNFNNKLHSNKDLAPKIKKSFLSPILILIFQNKKFYLYTWIL
jgi:hypothetical protein